MPCTCLTDEDVPCEVCMNEYADSYEEPMTKAEIISRYGEHEDPEGL